MEIDSKREWVVERREAEIERVVGELMEGLLQEGGGEVLAGQGRVEPRQHPQHGRHAGGVRPPPCRRRPGV